METWLIWRLTGQHVTDYSNASRTMLFDIHRLCWDEELCRLLRIPACMLPERWRTAPSTARCSRASPVWRRWQEYRCAVPPATSRRPLFGQACFHPGEAKNTYGTGCFTLMNVGTEPVRSRAGLVSSVAWSVGGQDHLCLGGQRF